LNVCHLVIYSADPLFDHLQSLSYLIPVYMMYVRNKIHTWLYNFGDCFLLSNFNHRFKQVFLLKEWSPMFWWYEISWQKWITLQFKFASLRYLIHCCFKKYHWISYCNMKGDNATDQKVPCANKIDTVHFYS
jgi:hypothetical protein